MESLYAQPRDIRELSQCYFYHSLELPDVGRVNGDWDLSQGLDDYLGHVDFAGKRVLEMGTASGQLCFHMESKGAEVVAFDLAPDRLWDVVPLACHPDIQAYIQNGKSFLEAVRNSYWYAHAALGSRARVHYGHVYDIPADLGIVDIVTYGCILLHLRDPFLALANGLRLSREKVIVTGPMEYQPGPSGPPQANPETPAESPAVFYYETTPKPPMLFLPQPVLTSDLQSWWDFSPKVLQQMIACLGFERSHVTYHEQRNHGRPIPMYTIVGERTQPLPQRVDGPYPWF